MASKRDRTIGEEPSSRGSSPRRWLAACLLLLAASSCAGPRADDPYFSEWKRIEAMREVAESLRYEVGEYPSDLAAICEGASQYNLLCHSTGEVPIQDRWGGQIWYEPTEAHYRVGTAGPDGERGTPDDLEIDSAAERERVQRGVRCEAGHLSSTGSGRAHGR